MDGIDRTSPGVIRARVGKATAAVYEGSHRITVVADERSFTDALAAITALRDEVC